MLSALLVGCKRLRKIVDSFAMCDSISYLLHERKKAIKVMRLFHQSLVDIKAEPIAIGDLFNIALLSIVAYAMWARKVLKFLMQSSIKIAEI